MESFRRVVNRMLQPGSAFLFVCLLGWIVSMAAGLQWGTSDMGGVVAGTFIVAILLALVVDIAQDY